MLDQDEALDFYVGKLGLEVNTRRRPRLHALAHRQRARRPDREILLERPGPPAMDDATAAQVRELVTKGATGFTVVFTTDDCQKTYDELMAKGVEFTQEPTSAPTASTAACATRSATTSASSSPSAAESTRKVRASAAGRFSKGSTTRYLRTL